MHAFGCQPKSPNPLMDPAGYAREQEPDRAASYEFYITARYQRPRQ